MADATFTWDLDPSHNAYEVTIRDITNSGPVVPITPPLIIPPVHSKIIYDLTANTQYEFCVRANCDPDGVTPWICKTETTPNIPEFKVSCRVYNPLGNGGGDDNDDSGFMYVGNSTSSAISTEAGSSPTVSANYIERIFKLSDFTNNIIKITMAVNNTQCEAVYIFRNGVRAHGFMFNMNAGFPTYSLDMNSLTYPFTIAEFDVIDFVLVLNNQATTAGDPYVHPSYVGTCGTTNPLII